MTAAHSHRGVSRSIAWRLAAGVLPAVLAVGLLVGLYYYGQYAHVVPAWVFIVAAVLTETGRHVEGQHARGIESVIHSRKRVGRAEQQRGARRERHR